MIKESIQQRCNIYKYACKIGKYTHIHMDRKQVFTDLKRKRHQYNNIPGTLTSTYISDSLSRHKIS